MEREVNVHQKYSFGPKDHILGGPQPPTLIQNWVNITGFIWIWIQKICPSYAKMEFCFEHKGNR